MRSIGLKKLGVTAALGLAFLIVGASSTNAQYRRENDRDRYERQQRQYERNQRRDDRDWSRDQRRRTRDDRYDNNYRRNLNGAFDQGYQQGMIAGQSDRRKGKYGRSNVYRNSGSYPNAGDPSSIDYLQRQGYLQGYDDGYYGRRRY